MICLHLDSLVHQDQHTHMLKFLPISHQECKIENLRGIPHMTGLDKRWYVFSSLDLHPPIHNLHNWHIAVYPSLQFKLEMCKIKIHKGSPASWVKTHVHLPFYWDCCWSSLVIYPSKNPAMPLKKLCNVSSCMKLLAVAGSPSNHHLLTNTLSDGTDFTMCQKGQKGLYIYPTFMEWSNCNPTVSEFNKFRDTSIVHFAQAKTI